MGVLKFFHHSLERAGGTARIQKPISAYFSKHALNLPATFVPVSGKLQKNLIQKLGLKQILFNQREALTMEGRACFDRWEGNTLLIGHTLILSDPLFKYIVNRWPNKAYKVNILVYIFLNSCALILRITLWHGYKAKHSSQSLLSFRSLAAPGKWARLLSSLRSPWPSDTESLGLSREDVLQEQKMEDSKNPSPLGCFIAKYSKLL